jgi:iron(III) transport system substrate-binding protein
MSSNSVRQTLAARTRLHAFLAILTLVVGGGLVGCGAGGGRTPVVVYSPHGGDMLSAFEQRFETDNPTYDLQFLDLASQTVLDRLRAERANPQCDVWWGASAATFATAADEGLLEPYRPAWGDALPSDAHDQDYRWVGLYETPEVLVYNNVALTEADAPRDWDDLLDPKWKGKILIRDPGASDTMRTIFGAMILREWDKSNGPDAGFEWLRRLAANTKDYPATWDAVLTSLNRQEAILSVWNMPDVKRVAAEKGYNLATRVPTSGSPIVTDGIAIVKGAPHTEAAKVLFEYVSSPDSLVFAAEHFYRIPARTDFDKARLPQWMRELEVKRMPMDWVRYRSGIKDWMSFWSDRIRGGGA